jgi:hypothetical protein
MSISGISSGSVAAAYTPPPVQQAQQAPAPQKAATADTVSLSKLALQLASDGDTQVKEAGESGAEKAGESFRGKA